MADLTPARRRALVSVLARALLADARERVAAEQAPAEAAPQPKRPRLLTVAEIARVTALSADHVRRAIERGELAAGDYRSPGAARAVYRVRPEEVSAWLERAERDRASERVALTSCVVAVDGTRTSRAGTSARSTPKTKPRPANDSAPSSVIDLRAAVGLRPRRSRR